MQKKTDAFTLLETLVVISLISALVALLLPSLASARATARLVPCQANLRQFHSASMSYAADFNEKVPGTAAYETAFSSGGNPSRSPSWHMRTSRTWHQTPAPIVINMQKGYLPKNKDIAWCPDRPREESPSNEFWSRDIDDQGWGMLGSRYGVNGFRWSSKSNDSFDQYWQYKNGGSIFEMEWLTHQSAFYMTETAGTGDVFSAFSLDPTLKPRQARHQNRLNVSFPDGHIKVFGYEVLYKLIDTQDTEFCWGE